MTLFHASIGSPNAPKGQKSSLSCQTDICKSPTLFKALNLHSLNVDHPDFSTMSNHRLLFLQTQHQLIHLLYSLLSFKILVFVNMKSLIVVTKVTFFQHWNMLSTWQTHSCPLHFRKYIRKCPPFSESCWTPDWLNAVCCQNQERRSGRHPLINSICNYLESSNNHVTVLFIDFFLSTFNTIQPHLLIQRLDKPESGRSYCRLDPGLSDVQNIKSESEWSVLWSIWNIDCTGSRMSPLHPTVYTVHQWLPLFSWKPSHTEVCTWRRSSEPAEQCWKFPWSCCQLFL